MKLFKRAFSQSHSLATSHLTLLPQSASEGYCKAQVERNQRASLIEICVHLANIYAYAASNNSYQIKRFLFYKTEQHLKLENLPARPLWENWKFRSIQRWHNKKSWRLVRYASIATHADSLHLRTIASIYSPRENFLASSYYLQALERAIFFRWSICKYSLGLL